MILTLSIILLVISIWLIGSLVYVRNVKDRANQYFGLFTLVLGAWVLANFLAANNHYHSFSNPLTHMDFFLGPFVVLLFWFFTRSFYKNFPNNTYNRLLPIGLSIVAVSTSAFSLFKVFYKSSFTPSAGLVVDYTSLYYVYSLAIILIAGMAILNLVFAYRKSRGIEKIQAFIILVALFISAGLLVFANSIVPLLSSSERLNFYIGNISYVGLLVFVGATAYTVIRHKLFDIRFTIARTIGYLSTIVLVSALFIAPSLIVSVHLLGASISAFNIAALIFVTCVIAISFQLIKRRVDHLANKLFYRDYYSIQDVIDKLGNLLVSSIDPKRIISESKKILNDAINPTSIRFIFNFQENLTVEDKEVLDTFLGSPRLIYILDEMNEGSNKNILHAMQANNIYVSVKLRTRDGDLGILILGYKKSGIIYSEKDKRLLTIAADEIAISLQNALRFEEIQKFNITLKDQIEEATKKLRLANAKLKIQDETKDDFISMASHQLRTPLTSVKGYLSMVIEGDAGKLNSKQTEMLNQAFFSAQRMVYLISDLLNVSRLKSGKFIIEPSEVNLANVVEEELSQVMENITAKNLKLNYQKPKDFPVISIDETKTRQVIMNFIDNAIYYTPLGGELEVSLTSDADSVELRVKDNGIGVAKRDQPHLFTKFYRASNARKARPDGTGIGLYMAKKVIIAEGGSLIFESEEGKGSTFGFRFSKNIQPTKE